jgi:hypothetical protein
MKWQATSGLFSKSVRVGIEIVRALNKSERTKAKSERASSKSVHNCDNAQDKV